MSSYTIALVHRMSASGEIAEVYELVRKRLAYHGLMVTYFHELPKVEQDGVGRESIHLQMDVMIENPGEGHAKYCEKYGLSTSADQFLYRAQTAAWCIRVLTTHADAEMVYEKTGMAYNHKLIKPLGIIYSGARDHLKCWTVKLVRPPLPKKSKNWTPGGALPNVM